MKTFKALYAELSRLQLEAYNPATNKETNQIEQNAIKMEIKKLGSPYKGRKIAEG